MNKPLYLSLSFSQFYPFISTQGKNRKIDEKGKGNKAWNLLNKCICFTLFFTFFTFSKYIFHILKNALKKCMFKTRFFFSNAFHIFNSIYYNPSVAKLTLINLVSWQAHSMPNWVNWNCPRVRQPILPKKKNGPHGGAISQVCWLNPATLGISGLPPAGRPQVGSSPGGRCCFHHEGSQDLWRQRTGPEFRKAGMIHGPNW